jgi:hypothetical protein
VREPDATFSDPRQAALYDVFNNDRSDLEAYVAIADEVEAHRVTLEGSIAIGEEVMRSTSTLRFRERNELERDLSRYGFNVLDVRDAPDRPGKEMVFLSRRC